MLHCWVDDDFESAEVYLCYTLSLLVLLLLQDSREISRDLVRLKAPFFVPGFGSSISMKFCYLNGLHCSWVVVFSGLKMSRFLGLVLITIDLTVFVALLPFSYFKAATLAGNSSN